MQMILLLAFAASAPALAQTQYTQGGDPYPSEQYALELINRARSNPTAEGTRLAIPGGITEGLTPTEVTDTGSRPPLAMNSILLAIARAHSLDMWTRNYFAHDTLPPPTPILAPWDRATAAGYIWNKFGENIATGSSHTVAMLEDILMRDLDPVPYPGRGHRKNLLDIDDTSTIYFREIGVGSYSGTSSKSNILKDVLTEDFGRRSAVGPFIVGVVYNDLNGNGFYDIGEELPGVTVRFNPQGTYYAVSATAGGYSFPYTGTGNVTIEATGGAFGAGIVTRTISLTGENVKVDFKLGDLNDADGDGLLDSWEMSNFLSLAETATGDYDSDGASNLAEFNAGTDPTDPLSFPAAGGAPRSGGACGSTGLDLLWPLGLLWLRRRSRRLP